VDADGCALGKIHEVRLRRDGAILPGFGPALRIEGFVVGKGARAIRLGFARPEVTGPWPFNLWGARAARRARFVPWKTVEFRDGHILTSIHRADLRSAYS
jgi:hypothetical protein